LTHAFLILIAVGLRHGVYRKLHTLIGGQRAEKFQNHCFRVFAWLSGIRFAVLGLQVYRFRFAMYRFRILGVLLHCGSKNKNWMENQVPQKVTLAILVSYGIAKLWKNVDYLRKTMEYRKC